MRLFLPLLLATLSLTPEVFGQDQGAQWGEWSALGPFAHPEGGTGIETAHPVEKEFRKMKPGRTWKELEKTYRGKNNIKVSWLSVPESKQMDAGVLNCSELLPAVNNSPLMGELAAAYFYRTIHCEEETEIRIHCGADDAIRIWLNGEILLTQGGDNAMVPSAYAAKLHLKKGVNHLALKVVNTGGPWSCRLGPFQRISQDKINQAIDQGVQFLLDHQLIDGSWANSQGAERNGQTALSVYTLIKSGIPKNHAAILNALSFLEEVGTSRTYSAGCHLMALEALKDEDYLPWMDEILGDLISWQRNPGTWAYPTGTPDLSTTQFAALGLRAAKNAGLEISDKVWLDLLRGVLDFQKKKQKISSHPNSGKKYSRPLSIAGYTYHPDPLSTARGSMTVAGISTLKICIDALGGRLPNNLKKEARRQIDLGMNWLNAYWTVSRNVGTSAHLHYFLYGLERVGAFFQTEFIGDHEWYWEGARFLVESQVPNGNWPTPSTRYESATCFALLFLKRASSIAVTDPNGHKTRAVSTSPAEANTFQIRVTAGLPCNLWVYAVQKDSVDSSHFAEVEYFGKTKDQDWAPLFTVGATEHPIATDRLAGRHAFDQPGQWQVKAVAHYGDQKILESGIATIDVVEIRPEGTSTYPKDASKNRLPNGKPRVTASSGNAKKAADNRAYTHWLTSQNDLAPEITFEFTVPISADKILLTHARTRVFNQKTRKACASWIRVFVNEENPFDFEMAPHFQEKSTIALSEVTSIKKLRIQILEVLHGELGKSTVGFTEVELQGPRKRRRQTR